MADELNDSDSIRSQELTNLLTLQSNAGTADHTLPQGYEPLRYLPQVDSSGLCRVTGRTITEVALGVRQGYVQRYGKPLDPKPMQSLSRWLGFHVAAVPCFTDWTRSFKDAYALGQLRGQLTLSGFDKLRDVGVTIVSTGNYAGAICFLLLSGNTLLPVTVYLPASTAARKVKAIRDLGVEPIFVDGTMDDAAAVALEESGYRGSKLLSPYDDPCGIGGNGIFALGAIEWARAHGLHVVATTRGVGGGGFGAGTGGVEHTLLGPGTMISAAELDGQASMAEALLMQTEPRVLITDARCDATAVARAGHHPANLLRSFGAQPHIVQWSSVVSAMRLIRDDLDLIVEPSAALGVAAILENLDAFRAQVSSKNDVVLAYLTGLNVSPEIIKEVWPD